MGPPKSIGRSVARSVRRNRAASVLVVVVCSVALAGCLGGAGSLGGPQATTGNATGAPSAVTGGPSTATVTEDGTSAGNGTDTGNLSVHFIHVGQGASVLVVGPTGETLLYDTGDWRDDGEHVLDYLRAHNVTRIDYLVTSHGDADHVGGHAAVIEYFETEADGIGAIYDPGIASASATYQSYLDAVEKHDVTLYRAQAGDSIPLAGASVSVLSPPAGYLDGRDRNENSLVLRIERGDASVLLTGDAERDAERYLLRKYDSRLNATILMAGHHGSNTSTGPGLLAATTPRAIAIQSAYDSQYGHPHRELLARLAERGVPTYWTGVHGTVVFETDGERVTVRTRRAAPTDPLDLRNASGVAPGADDPLEVRATFPVRGSAAGPAPPPTETPEATVVADGGTETASSTTRGTTTAATATTSARDGPADALAVAEVHADARGDEYDNLNDEYVVLRNEGDRTLDLSGWTVADEAGHTYTFPDGTALAPGETLTLHTGIGSDTATDHYWNSESPVWNNGGDTVFVRDADGTVVLEVSYDS